MSGPRPESWQDGDREAAFLEAMAASATRADIPRPAGRALAVLLLRDPRPLDMDELAVAAGSSRGALSFGLRLLVGRGVVERRRPLGSRRDVYRVPPETGAAFVELLLEPLRGLRAALDAAPVHSEAVGAWRAAVAEVELHLQGDRH